MKAGDIIFYQALKEQKLAVLALQEARKHGRTEPNGDDLKTIYETLIKEDFGTAMDQASSEGFTGRDQKLRAYEIMEQSRPEYAVQEAENFAAKGTFNYKPTGTLGRVANSLNNMRRDLPAMNYVVPFVNTVINVANEYLNYHPLFGGIRYVRQATGWGKAKQRLSDEERARVGVKALVGTIAMAALFLLDDPEDEESLFEITANGTGSTKKNYELERTGWRSYSIRIGDTWYSYKNTPLALPLATVGFMKDAQRYGKTPDVESIATIAAMGSLKFIMDLNTLSSLADFFSLFDKENISEYTSSFDQAKRQLTKVTKSFIIPNFITQMSKLTQELTETPNKRANNVVEEVIRDLPYFRDRLDNMYDAFGDPVVPKQLEKLIPLNAHRSPADIEMFKFLQDNKLFVGVPAKTNRKPNGEPMTEEEYNQFAIQSARATKARILREYKMYARENKEEIKQWFDDVREEERRQAKLDLFGY